MKPSARILFISIIVPALLLTCQRGGKVAVTDRMLAIPTYKIGPASAYPDWKHKTYPYTMLETITDSLGSQEYRAVTLENEFVKILVLPDIGGRLHHAYDKTNGYCYLYDQKTIKPAKVGLTGAWISGGIEYNFPTGHRHSGFRPVDYYAAGDRDGAGRVWTGEYEMWKGMRWSVEHVLRPGSSVLETRVRLSNPTPYTQAFQFWATGAVHITPEYQAVYPMDIWTGHGKQEFGRFPVHNGRDISFWKNTEGPSSYFAWDCDQDFFGGYSHDRRAGTAIYADHGTVPGKKLWTWGTGGIGQMWEKILTDSGGHYFEPQAGGYADNQPDQHWLEPGETKVFSIFWYPVRETGAFKEANREGAVNVEERGGDIFVAVSATRAHRAALVTLARKDANLLERKADLGPDRPFTATVAKPPDCALPDLTLTVRDGNDTLITYTPIPPRTRDLPVPVYPGQAVPAKVSTLDSLYAMGAYFNRFDNQEQALAFFDEALRRDPRDARCNTEKALILLKRGLAADAFPLLQTAVEKDPENGRGRYYLALAQLQRGDTAGAAKNLTRAAYDRNWAAPALYQLGLIDMRANQPAPAAARAEASLAADGNSSQARALLVAARRRAGQPRAAGAALTEALSADPLNFWLALEGSLAKVPGPAWKKLLRNSPQNHIALALDYARIGELKRAVNILRACTAADDPHYPMTLYYQGYFLSLLGKAADAKAVWDRAGARTVPACFPYRLEDIEVLQAAIRQNPRDAAALNYLGLLLYSKKRPAEALPLWEQSAALRPEAGVYRNIGWAQGKDFHRPEAAAQAYARALSLEKNPQYLYEMCQVQMKLDPRAGALLQLLQQYPDLPSRHDDLLCLHAAGLILEGRYAEALDRLNGHQFHSWEGSDLPHVFYRAALCTRAEQALAAKKYDEAARCLDSARLWPFHLQVSWAGDKFEQKIDYLQGLLCRATGEKAEAKAAWERAAVPPSLPTMVTVYSARALQELGKAAEARTHLDSVIRQIDLIAERHGGAYRAPHHLVLAEAYKLLGDQAKSQAHRKAALELDPLAELLAYSLRYFLEE